MKKFIFSPEVKHITMPNNHSMQEWKDFFKKLMDVDYFAPFHAIVAAYSFLAEEEVAVPSSVYGSLYYDLGIELRADDRFPAEDAAWETGFMAKGVSMVVHMAAMHDERYEDMMKIITDLFNNNHYVEENVSKDVTLLANSLLANHDAKLNKVDVDGISKNINRVEEHDVKWSTTCLEEMMKEDPNAPASILSYYLEAVVKEPCTIFCPLGCEQYRDMGTLMAESEVVFETARNTGLMAAACHTYFRAALDNETNWDIMRKGIKFLMDNPQTRCFIPYRERYVAEKLLVADAVLEIDEDLWRLWRDKINDDFGDESQGY